MGATDGLDLVVPVAPSEYDGDVLVKAENLGLATKRGEVFEEIYLTVGPGQLVALTGPGGSGMTSLLLVLAGRMKFTSGTLEVAGQQITPKSKWLRKHVSLSPFPFIDDLVDNMRVSEELRQTQLMAFGQLRSVQGAELLELVGLDVSPKTFVGDLDEYQRSRLRLALGLVVDLPIVCLDDFFRAVPIDETSEFWKTLRDVVDTTGATLFCNSTNPPPPDSITVDVQCAMRPVPTGFLP